ncbi:hypothetical protein O6H91_04G054600 [Diphasiastrum complanatum]|uniref:Uncharacterized protein n=1 Tax=Diphasiastrum complanatum TaxID=34168 RepID=A0ACC2DWY2_DIPCM|nr:hypothetical protein O6H91_04G054600 [Diphasiastrum complanatum]
MENRLCTVIAVLLSLVAAAPVVADSNTFLSMQQNLYARYFKNIVFPLPGVSEMMKILDVCIVNML